MRERSNTARWTVWLAAGAMFLAPFIALLYRAEAGLIVMALALGATSLLLHGMLDVSWLRSTSCSRSSVCSRPVGSLFADKADGHCTE